jgi:hypothetical protein
MMPRLLEYQDEFLQDLVLFLEARGHSRLVPPTGLDAFPEVVLNGKRLDLYNLYKEVSYQFLVLAFWLFLLYLSVRHRYHEIRDMSEQ